MLWLFWMAALASPPCGGPVPAVAVLAEGRPGPEQALDALAADAARARVEALRCVRPVAGPGLPYQDLRLALACAAEDGEAACAGVAPGLQATCGCLAKVAETGHPQLLLPRVRRRARGFVVEVVWYRHLAQPPVLAPRRVVADEAAVPGAVDALVGELFGRPVAAPEPTAAPAPAPAGAVGAPVSPRPARRWPAWVPWAVGGAGAALVVGGAVAGGLAASAEGAYHDATVTDEASADRALADLDTARGRATAANILYGVGGAALVTGAVLYLFDRAGDGPTAFQAAPTIGAGQVGLQGGWTW